MITKDDLEKIKTEAFAEAIAELKQEFSNDFEKLKQLNEIEAKQNGV